MILSNDGLIAFHYRSYGTFLLQQKRPIIPTVISPTTEIIEPLSLREKTISLFFVIECYKILKKR